MYKIFVTYKCLNCGATVQEDHNYSCSPIDEKSLDAAAFGRVINARISFHDCNADTKGVLQIVNISRKE